MLFTANTVSEKEIKSNEKMQAKLKELPEIFKEIQ